MIRMFDSIILTIMIIIYKFIYIYI